MKCFLMNVADLVDLGYLGWVSMGILNVTYYYLCDLCVSGLINKGKFINS